MQYTPPNFSSVHTQVNQSWGFILYSIFVLFCFLGVIMIEANNFWNYRNLFDPFRKHGLLPAPHPPPPGPLGQAAERGGAGINCVFRDRWYTPPPGVRSDALPPLRATATPNRDCPLSAPAGNGSSKTGQSARSYRPPRACQHSTCRRLAPPPPPSPPPFTQRSL